jgi:hypothetical protein
MARSTILTVSPDLDLDKGFAQIEAERLAQVQGAERFGQDMDARLQAIYGQLTGALQQGARTTGTIYDNASQQVRSAYEGAGATSAAGAQQVQSRLAERAGRLGLDQRALAEVSGRLGEQAMGHQFRNQTSMADRMATQAQLGAGMSAVSQFAINAAQQAAAQGRQDLARRIATEIQRANTLAAAARTDFTAVKANQAARAAAAAETEARRAMAELVREQRAAARAAASEARANMRAARAGGRGGGHHHHGKYEFDPLGEALAMSRLEQMNTPDPRDVAINAYHARNFGPKATQYIEERLRGKRTPGSKKGLAQGLDIPQLERYVRDLRAVKYRG